MLKLMICFCFCYFIPIRIIIHDHVSLLMRIQLLYCICTYTFLLFLLLDLNLFRQHFLNFHLDDDEYIFIESESCEKTTSNYLLPFIYYLIGIAAFIIEIYRKQQIVTIAIAIGIVTSSNRHSFTRCCRTIFSLQSHSLSPLASSAEAKLRSRCSIVAWYLFWSS